MLLSTVLATGYVYKLLGWGLIIVVLTLLFGRVFCNWICPYGTLHQFVAWLFNTRSASGNIKTNRYHPLQYLKYSILVVFLLMAAMGALQIGLLDPIVMMYRAMAVFFAPIFDGATGGLGSIAEGAGAGTALIDWLKFSPGVDNRIFVGSFWVGVIFLFFLLMNLWKPRFFCRYVCPLGAMLGSLPAGACSASIVSLTNAPTATSACSDARVLPIPIR